MGKAREFLDFWMQNSIHAAEQFGTVHPNGCKRRLSPADLEAEVGDLSEYIKAALVDANAKEQVRKNHN